MTNTLLQNPNLSNQQISIPDFAVPIFQQAGWIVVGTDTTGATSSPGQSSIPPWAPNTPYPAGWVVLAPTGAIVSAKAAFTTGSSYDATKWTVINDVGSGGGGAATQAAVAALGFAPDLTDATVSGSSGQLAPGVTSNVVSGGAYTSPAVPASVGTPPARFAVKVPASATANVTVTYPNSAGTTVIDSLLPGSSRIYRQKSTSGWGVEAGNTEVSALSGIFGTVAATKRVFDQGITRGLTVGAAHGTNAGQYTTGYNNGKDSCNVRMSHVLEIDVIGVRFLYENVSAQETIGANVLNIQAGLEYPAASTIPATIAGKGASLYALDPGASVLTDFIPLDAPAGTTIYERVFVNTPAGGSSTWPAIRTCTAALGDGVTLGNLADPFASLAWSSTAIGANAYSAYCASAVLVYPKNGATPIWIGVDGDSIAAGTGDPAAASVFTGFVARALEAASVPLLTNAVPGKALSQYVNLATSYRSRARTAGAPVMFVQAGCNDMMQNGGSLATCQASFLSWAKYRAGMGARVFTNTVTTRTTSTDSWSTTGNQSQASSANETTRQAYNAWIRAGAPIDPTTKAAVAVGTLGALVAGNSGHPLASFASMPLGFVEIADVFEGGRNTGVVAVPGVTFTCATTSGSSAITGVTAVAGTVANGLTVIGSGIPSGAIITAYNSVAKTATLVSATGGAANATATATGVACATAYTADGIHPNPALAALLAAAMPTNFN